MRTAVVLAVTVLGTSAFARDSGLGEKALQLAASAGEGVKAVREAFTNSATPVQAQGQIEVAFSPNLGAEELVIRVTDSAKKDLRVMAYAFTSSKITSALIRAAKEALHESVLALLWRCPSQISVCFRYLGAPSGRCARATARFWRPYAPCTRSCPMHCSSLCLAIHRLPNANNVTICAVFFLSPR